MNQGMYVGVPDKARKERQERLMYTDEIERFGEEDFGPRPKKRQKDTFMLELEKHPLLTGVHKDVLTSRFVHDASYREIGNIYGIDASTAYRLCKEAMDIIKAKEST